MAVIFASFQLLGSTPAYRFGKQLVQEYIRLVKVGKPYKLPQNSSSPEICDLQK